MKKLIQDPKAFVDNFAKAFHKNAKFYFYVSTTSTKNKFLMKLKIGDTPYYIGYSTHQYFNGNEIYVSLDSAFKKAHPDLMLRNGTTVTIDDLIEKYHCDEQLVLSKVIDAIRKIFNNRYYKESGIIFKAECHSYDLAGKCEYECISLKPAKSFEEFVVNIDLDVK